MTHLFNLARGWNVEYRVLFVPLMGLALVLQLWMGNPLPALATATYELPTVSAGDPTWIVDEGDVLSRLNQGNITGTLETLAKTTGNEVRFVTIHRLDYGETIESFTNKLFEAWFPTTDAQSDQTLMVLDTVTNTAAIHTGDAVKARLPDEIATSVAQETLLVPLRNGNRYNQAFLDASDRLVAVLSGQLDPGAPVVTEVIDTEGTFATPEETAESNATVWVIGLLLAATVIPMATYYFYQGMQ